jgi:putative tricarboxylic transport membrane protein
MADARRAPRFNLVPAVVGVLLLALAGLLTLDAASLTLATPYGLGPQAVPYLVAGGLFILGCAHLVTAARGFVPDTVVAAIEGAPVHPEPSDPAAVAWIVGGLVALIATIGLGGGFVPATALLFAATARAFGRRALLVDLLIGFGFGLVVYLAFTRLLTLSLPQGPLERLL